jgi:hypothetical protein
VSRPVTGIVLRRKKASLACLIHLYSNMQVEQLSVIKMVLIVQFAYFSVSIFYNGSFDDVFLSRHVPYFFFFFSPVSEIVF